MKLLIVEDETYLSESICSYFKQQQDHCDVAPDLQTATYKLQQQNYDCILLDLQLPDGNGLDFLQILRENNKSQLVIIISANNQVKTKISGLDLGADDYLCKPFHLSELRARIATVVRRKNFGGHTILAMNELSINTATKTALFNNTVINLTRKEYDLLLYFFLQQRNCYFKKRNCRAFMGRSFRKQRFCLYTRKKSQKKIIKGRQYRLHKIGIWNGL